MTLLVACGGSEPTPTSVPTTEPTATALPTNIPISTEVSTATLAPIATAAQEATATKILPSDNVTQIQESLVNPIEIKYPIAREIISTESNGAFNKFKTDHVKFDKGRLYVQQEAYVWVENPKKPGSGEGSVVTIKNATTSEGVAYFFRAAVEEGTNDDIKAAYNTVKALQNDKGLASWVEKGKILDKASVADADLDIIAALINTVKSGRFAGTEFQLELETFTTNYISYFKSHYFTESNTFKPGFWGGSEGDPFIRPDYLRVGIFEQISQLTGDKFWTDKSIEGLDILLSSQNPETGFVPQTFYLDTKTPKESDGSLYGYDSIRDAEDVAYLLPLISRNDPRFEKGVKFLERKNSFYEKQNLRIVDGYELTGKPVGGSENAAFFGPAVIASVLSKDQKYQNGLFYKFIKLNDGGYYSDGRKIVTLVTLKNLINLDVFGSLTTGQNQVAGDMGIVTPRAVVELESTATLAPTIAEIATPLLDESSIESTKAATTLEVQMTANPDMTFDATQDGGMMVTLKVNEGEVLETPFADYGGNAKELLINFEEGSTGEAVVCLDFECTSEEDKNFIGRVNITNDFQTSLKVPAGKTEIIGKRRLFIKGVKGSLVITNIAAIY